MTQTTRDEIETDNDWAARMRIAWEARADIEAEELARLADEVAALEDAASR